METKHLSRKYAKSCTHCMYANFPDIFTDPYTSYFLCSTRYQRDERTWKSRLTDLHQNWKPLIEGLTDAYLRWKYNDSTGAVSGRHPPVTPSSDTVGNFDDFSANRSARTDTEDTTTRTPPAPCSEDLIDIEVTVIDIYTLSTSITLSRVDDKTTAVALASLGFIGNAPFKPSVAVSMKTLELYRLLRRRKASFSVEGFVKVICDLYNVGCPHFTLHTRSLCKPDPLSSQVSAFVWRCV